MPTYSYRCLEKYCGDITWVEHKMEDRPTVKCRLCGSTKVQRVFLQMPHMPRVLTPVGKTMHYSKEEA